MKKIIIFLSIIWMNSVCSEVALKTVECALTYRIMHFTDIPVLAGKYNICVNGDLEIKKLLTSQLNGKEFKGGKINVVSGNSKNMTTCSLIYIGKATKLKKHQIEKAVKSHKLLVFSSIESLKHLSVINYKKGNGKIEFNVNKTLLDKHKIIMSTKVLRLASEVY